MGLVLRREKDGFVFDNGKGLWRSLREQADGGKRYRLTTVYDRNGNRIHLDYDQGALSRITDSVGRVVRVEPTPEGRIASLSVKNAQTRGQWVFFARYEYNDRGELTRAVDADGFENRYGYDARGRHLLVENGYKTGLVFFFRYDKEIRCVESYGAYPGAPDPSLAAGLPTKLADGVTPLRGVHHVLVDYLPDGFRHVHDSTRTESYLANEHGLLDRSTIGGAVTTSTYRDDGFLTNDTDALGGERKYERDSRGRLLEVTDELGHLTRYERDERGLVVKVIDPEGGITELVRDGRGNVEVVRDAAGGVTSYQRNQRGQVTSITDARGATTLLGYDPEANLETVTLPNGATWRYGHDPFGRLTWRTDPLAATTHYAYSDRGDLRSERDALGQVTRYDYDGDGYLTQLVNPVGALTKLHWGGLHKLCERVDASRRCSRR